MSDQVTTATAEPVRYAATATIAPSKVDADAGIMRDVAIMSIGEAAGHGCRVDMATLQGLFQLTSGKSVKAFLNHSYNPSPTEAIGIFSGLYIDAKEGILRAATFTAFKSFREHNKQAFDTLFELAATAPESFGVSVSIYQSLEDASDGGDPFIRPSAIESADFVSTPAANKALFSQKVEIESQSLLDNAETVSHLHSQVETESQKETEPQPKISTHFFTMKAVFSHFSKSERNARALPLIAKFSAEAEAELSEGDMIEKVEAQLDAEDQAALIAENAALKVKVAELEGKIAELSPAAAEVEDMKAKVGTLTAQVEQLSKRTARFGVRPLNLGKPETPATALTATKAEFDAKTPAERMAFSKAGGRITE